MEEVLVGSLDLERSDTSPILKPTGAYYYYYISYPILNKLDESPKCPV